jgi:hypothetical protein
VLVEILARGREIEIRARGPERKALLSAVAADVDAINESIQGLPDRVDQWIPCRCSTCLTAAEPHFFAQKKLRKRLEDRKTRVECEVSYEEVDVLELLDGIRAAATPAWTAAAPRPIRIFLASSQELSSDRDSFDLYCRQLNDQLRKDGIALEVVRWEFFLDAMSETRLQDEYNKAICESDLFVSLFFTKTGKYTEEEFDAAHARFQATGRPRIYTFFKNQEIEIDGARKEDLLSLWTFQEKLEKLGHFRTRYNNIDHLKQQFRDQIDRLLDAGL